jgi:hypothetical protein
MSLLVHELGIGQSSLFVKRCLQRGAGVDGGGTKLEARSLEGANATADLTGWTATHCAHASISFRQHFYTQSTTSTWVQSTSSATCWKLRTRNALLGAADHVHRRHSLRSRMWRRLLDHGTKAQAPTLGDESSLYRPTLSNTRRPTQPTR